MVVGVEGLETVSNVGSRENAEFAAGDIIEGNTPGGAMDAAKVCTYWEEEYPLVGESTCVLRSKLALI